VYLAARFREFAVLFEPVEELASSHVLQHHVQLVWGLFVDVHTSVAATAVKRREKRLETIQEK
jgi:hypothetical protein